MQPIDPIEELESKAASEGLVVLSGDFGKMLDSGNLADVFFTVGAGGPGGSGVEEIAAHAFVLAARSPYFATKLAERWGEGGAGPSTAGTSERCVIAVTDMEPDVFRQLLRYLYTGRCDAGALAAMPDHLLDASAKHAVKHLQEVSASAMQLKLSVENVCDYFALAHAHGLDELKDACAELMDKNMTEISQSDGFKRLLVERPPLAGEMYKHMAEMRSPAGQSRKRKRKDP